MKKNILLPLLLCFTGLLPAQDIDTSDLRQTGAASTPIASVTFGPGAPLPFYDFLDGASAPEGKSLVGDFYKTYVGDYRDARGRLEGRDGKGHAELARQTFSSFLGLTSWTAASCRDAVLETLAFLAARRRESTGSEAAFYARLEKELAGDVAARTEASGRGGAKQAIAVTVPAEGLKLSDFEKAGAQIWDYDLAALRLMEWMDRRDTLLGSPRVAELLANGPDPATRMPALAELEREVAALGQGAWGSGAGSEDAARGSRRLAGLLNDVKAASDRRERASRWLATLLGMRSINSRADLQRLVRRYLRLQRGDQNAAQLEAALERWTAAMAEEQQALRAYRAAASVHRDAIAAGLAATAGPAGAGGATVSTTSAAATTGIFDSLDPNGVPARLRKELYKADLSTSVKLVDMDIAEGIGISARYRWEVDGNFEDQFATRVDTWEFGASLRVGDLIKDIIDLPLGIGISANEKIVMARQFKSKTQAAIALPKLPLALPLSAERARKMEMGDFYSIPAEIAFATSIGLGYGVTPVNANASAHYVVNGRFHLQIFKTDADHVRVRLVGNKSQGPGGNANLGFSGLDLFSVKILSKAVERLLDLDVLRIGMQESDGIAMSVDYVFDLRDAEAAKAYEKITRASLKAGPLLAANAIIKSSKLDEKLMSDLRPAEDIYHQDSGLEPGRRRIDRIFKGTNTYSSSSKNFRIGTKLLRFDASSTWVDNLLRVFQADETTRDYQFPVYTFHSRWNALFGFFKEDHEQSMYALMPAGADGRATDVRDLVFSTTVQDKSARRGEVEDYKRAVARTLGETLSGEMDLDLFPVGSTEKFNSQVVCAIHGDALAAILDPARTPEEAVWNAVTRLIPDFDMPSGAGRREEKTMPWRYNHWPAAKKRAYEVCDREWGTTWVQLATVVDEFLAVQRLEQPLPEKTLKLMALGRERLFRVIGVRLLVELIGPSQMEQAAYVSLIAKAKGWKDFEASQGEDRFRELYALINEALYNIAAREHRR